MDLFSEIHSRYFYIINQVLQAAAVRRLTTGDIAALVAALGFAETPLTLTPRLLHTGREGYCLLQRKPDGSWQPVAPSLPPLLTTLQKRWLKTIIVDKRFTLFATAADLDRYRSLLAGVEPLYRPEQLLPVDMANDGDAYDSPEYRALFSTILAALQAGRVLLITYESGKGNRLSAYFAPYKLEYSLKDDKFRLVGVRIRQKKLRRLYKLNLARITAAAMMDWQAPAGLAGHIQSLRMPQPVEIAITNERNGFERIFTQLSNFERSSEYDETTKTCYMKIYYYEVDEMELLITLLSFGPVIRVLGPEDFRRQLAGRIACQRQRFAAATDNQDNKDKKNTISIVPDNITKEHAE